MRILQWRHTDWTARKFVFLEGLASIGELTFISHWNFNAVFKNSETRLKFSQESFWNEIVTITQNEKVIGTLCGGLSNQSLTLSSGEKYTLVSNFWGNDVKWKNKKGEVLIQYHQATLSSMGKGTIYSVDTLPAGTEILMISGGLFIRQLIIKRMLLAITAMLPVLMASRH